MKLLIKLPLLALALSALAGCSNTPQNSHPDYAPAQPIQYVPANTGSPTGSIYLDASNVSLFADTRARQVGDILTVVLSESTDAAKSSDTNLDKQSSTEVGNTVLAGKLEEDLDFNFGTGSNFAGESASNQKNRMQGTIAVTVADIMPNGNFYVQGEKWIQINQGNEYIRLRGIIRPVDISTSNTILSTQIADARISYSGTGATAQVNQAGWLSRFFLSPLWPF